jgi:hypothetical protein
VSCDCAHVATARRDTAALSGSYVTDPHPVLVLLHLALLNIDRWQITTTADRSFGRRFHADQLLSSCLRMQYVQFRVFVLHRVVVRY